jgi:hypothetical protein
LTFIFSHSITIGQVAPQVLEVLYRLLGPAWRFLSIEICFTQGWVVVLDRGMISLVWMGSLIGAIAPISRFQFLMQLHRWLKSCSQIIWGVWQKLYPEVRSLEI